MSLETTAVVETPASGTETSTAAPETSNEDTSRYEGFSSPDAAEPVEANQVEQTQEQQPEQNAEQAEAEAGESAEEMPESNEPDPWEGYEDYDFNGTTVKIPSNLKPFLMMEADYRKKTASVAERGRELDAREEQVNQRQKLSANEMDAHVAMSQVGAQLKQFEEINWAAEKAKCQDDPIALGELNAKWMEFHELRNLHQQGQNYLNEAARQRTEQAQQDTAKRHAATEAFAAKNIKGWGADLHKQIVTWAGESGIDEATLKQAYTPQVYSLLHKAFQWDQSLKRQQSAKPIPRTPQTPVTPTNTVTAKANVARSFDPETASVDDYAKDWAARQKRR